MSLAPQSERHAAPPPAIPQTPVIGLTVTTVAAVFILVSVAVRAVVAYRGFLTYDDFPLLSMAEKNSLHADYLFGLFNNHLMPAGHLLTWLTLRFGGFAYEPFLALMILGQLVVGIALYRLLRLMLLPGWGILVPLGVFLLSPLTLEATSWWAVGINMLPMQLAMVLALGAQVRFIRTRHRKHLVTLAASVLFGLMFFEKSLLAVALVFLTTLCLYTRGNPVRSLLTTIRQWWPSWLTLTVVSSAFLVFYLARSTSSLRRPSSAGEVVRFVTQMFTDTLVPGLLGGPWLWWPAGDGAPITAPTAIARWTALGVMVLFIAFTVWLRGSEAFRAWLLVLLYTALVVGLLGATRMGSVYSGVAGAVPRYISDVVVVAAVAIGAALCGLNREGAEPVPERKRAALLSGRFAVPALAAVVALLAASTAVTTWRFGDEWAIKRGRDYLATARADLAEAPAGTVFMDQPVPEEVVGRLSGPYNSQSEFFAPLKGDGPVFVIEARQLSIFDDAGHVRRARVDGVSAPPGPRQGCGYRVTGTKPVRIPLASSVVEYYHVVRIAYLSNQDSGATLRLGAGQAVAIDVHKGLNEMFVLVWGGGNTIELKLLDGTTGVCTDEVTVGQPVPASAG